jgi:hypothetical protein
VYAPAVAKKQKRPLGSATIADKIVRRLQETRNAQVIDLTAFRQAKQFTEKQRADDAEGTEGFHPLHATYTVFVNAVADAAMLLTDLPELAKITEQIAWAEEQYQGDGPPMSPITRSWYTNWTLFDVMTGPKRETLGTCVAAISKALGSHPNYVTFVEKLCQTRPGIYLHQGVEGDVVELRELVTDTVVRTLIPSGYSGGVGDMLLLRVMPPWHPAYPDLALALTTPYQIIDGGRLSWLAYFDRTLAKMGGERGRAYEALMKYGAPPHAGRYWTEYIFEAYANYETEVIFLEGLPDIAESRPHARVNGDVPANKPLKSAKIAKRPSADELRRLPKMSETIIEFGAPILREVGVSSAEQFEKIMNLVMMAWNFPLYEQQGEAKFTAELRQQMAEVRPRMPPHGQRVIDDMMQRRTTLRLRPQARALPRRFRRQGRLHRDGRVAIDGRPAAGLDRSRSVTETLSRPAHRSRYIAPTSSPSSGVPCMSPEWKKAASYFSSLYL